ncbi:MAG: GTP cyclohydrolase I [Aeropyrum sp.]|nr:GTP cyclohydrolase I [Aeropyrum sp.]MCE4615836.1 GTP cyclohydrolase I [Aeropyrum sp.]
MKAFDCPAGLRIVVEALVEATCPFTGAPDSYELEIEFVSKGKCVEAISLSRWLQSFRDQRITQEELASIIARAIKDTVEPDYACVRLSGSHGGIAMTVESCVEGEASQIQPM